MLENWSHLLGWGSLSEAQLFPYLWSMRPCYSCHPSWTCLWFYQKGPLSQGDLNKTSHMGESRFWLLCFGVVSFTYWKLTCFTDLHLHAISSRHLFNICLKDFCIQIRDRKLFNNSVLFSQIYIHPSTMYISRGTYWSFMQNIFYAAIFQL